MSGFFLVYFQVCDSCQSYYLLVGYFVTLESYHLPPLLPGPGACPPPPPHACPYLSAPLTCCLPPRPAPLCALTFWTAPLALGQSAMAAAPTLASPSSAREKQC